MTRQELAAATADHHCIPRDSVDRLLEHWHVVRPALDFSPVGVISRLDRVRGHVDVELDRLFGEYGLTAPGFAVLVTLARLNEPEGVSQRRLMDELGLTSGTVSVRMDRLQDAGLIERAPDEEDRRNTRVKLTDEGRALFERIVPAHLDNENRLLASLSTEERQLLATLLGKLLVEFEGSVPPSDAPFRLGMTVAPAHVTIALRSAVGLPPEPGLLVRRVEEDGPAAAAGVVAGDVVVAAGKQPIRSVAALYAAIADSAPTRRLKLQLLRGAKGQTVSIALDGLPSRAQGAMGASTRGRVGHDEHAL
jgi:DNA-binding MarR family transcriptional regulator